MLLRRSYIGEFSVQRQSVFGILALVMSLCGGLLSGCSTAANIGDDALRVASVGRVQATPFADILHGNDCRAGLDTAYGFPRESRGMKNGVFVVQSFSCRGDRINAKVSLTNHSGEPMYCFAQTETAQPGVWVAPQSAGFFEYTYADRAYHDCRRAD